MLATVLPRLIELVSMLPFKMFVLILSQKQLWDLLQKPARILKANSKSVIILSEKWITKVLIRSEDVQLVLQLKVFCKHTTKKALLTTNSS